MCEQLPKAQVRPPPPVSDEGMAGAPGWQRASNAVLPAHPAMSTMSQTSQSLSGLQMREWEYWGGRRLQHLGGRGAAAGRGGRLKLRRRGRRRRLLLQRRALCAQRGDVIPVPLQLRLAPRDRRVQRVVGGTCRGAGTAAASEGGAKNRQPAGPHCATHLQA